MTKRTQSRAILLASCFIILQVLFHCTTFSSLKDISDEMFMMAPPTDSHDTKMKNNHGFPRILHYIWPNKDFDFGPDDVSHAEQRRTLEIIDRIRHNNPDWTVIIWTDNECHEFMKQHFSHNYSDWISLKPKLKQWDAIRPCILWIHGGIYLDHDVDCNNGVKFDDWIHVDTKLLLRAPVTHSRNKIGNHFMGSTPHHPLWKLYLSNIWRETNLNYSVCDIPAHSSCITHFKNMLLIMTTN